MEKVKLSASLIKRKIAEGNKCKIADADLPGFYVRIGAKSVTFYLKRRQNKKIIEIKIGRFPDMTVDEARSHALDKIGAIANYQDVNAPSGHKDPLLREAFENFIKTQRSKQNVISALKNFSHLAERKIKSIHPDEITEVFNSKSETPYVANNMIRYLSSSIHKMEKQLHVKLPDLTSHIKKHPSIARTRFMQPHEAPEIIKNLNVLKKNPLYSAQAEALLLMIFTGQRKSRVLGITVEQIDIENRIWSVPGNDIKRPVYHPLNDYAWEIIENRLNHTERGNLFLWNGEPLKNCRKTFSRICKMSNVKNLHIHDLRRSLGSWMLSTGSSIEEVSKTLGHSSIATTEKVYAHLLQQRGRKVTTNAIAAMTSGDI